MPRSVEKKDSHSGFSPDSDWATALSTAATTGHTKMAATDADIASVAASNRTIRGGERENKKESYDERDDIVGFFRRQRLFACAQIVAIPLSKKL